LSCTKAHLLLARQQPKASKHYRWSRTQWRVLFD